MLILINDEIPKKEMGDNYGLAESYTVRVREDLPVFVKAFIVAHEYYHIKDTSKNVFLREVKATVMPLLGFLYIVICSLVSPSRLRFYIKRIKEGN